MNAEKWKEIVKLLTVELSKIGWGKVSNDVRKIYSKPFPSQKNPSRLTFMYSNILLLNIFTDKMHDKLFVKLTVVQNFAALTFVWKPVTKEFWISVDEPLAILNEISDLNELRKGIAAGLKGFPDGKLKLYEVLYGRGAKDNMVAIIDFLKEYFDSECSIKAWQEFNDIEFLKPELRNTFLF